MRVLVVESDHFAIKTIVDTLVSTKGCASLVGNGFSASTMLEAARKENAKFDAVIISVDVPGLNGIELLLSLRRAGDLTPVLMVSAHPSREEMVFSLDGGADDYMAKPLDHQELGARLRSITRRQQNTEPVATKVGNLSFDRIKSLFYVDETPVRLSPRASVVLEALFKRNGSVVSRDFLCALTPEMISIEALNIRISRIRKTLNDLKCSVTIKSQHAVGYALTEKSSRQNSTLRPKYLDRDARTQDVLSFFLGKHFTNESLRSVPIDLNRIPGYSERKEQAPRQDHLQSLVAAIEMGGVILDASSANDEGLSAQKTRFRQTAYQLVAHETNRVKDAFELNQVNSSNSLVSAMEDVCRNAASLVDKALSMAMVKRLETSGFLTEDFDVTGPVQDAVGGMQQLVAKKGITINAKIDAALTVSGEPELIQELVSCLLENSLRFSNVGTHIEISVKKNRCNLELIVEDQGPGVPTSERRNVLEPFYGHVGVDGAGNTLYGSSRQNNPIGTGKRNHGLGLPLVSSIVALHKGRVTLEDRSDGTNGLLVRCHLPLSSMNAPRSRASRKRN